MNPTVRGALALLPFVFAGSAAGQCQWSIDGVPDFDQRRTGSNAQGGLPAGTTVGQGGMFCAPTSAVNWMAYFANRGSPQSPTLAGPRDWQSQANYVRVSDTIRLMGVLMETDGQGGTGGSGQAAGLSAYNAFFAGGDFSFWRFSAWGTGTEISPSLLSAGRAMGGYMNVTYGYYGGSSGGTRDGGHVVTLSGLLGNCVTGSTIAILRDPADDAGNTTQSTFKNRLVALNSVTGSFRSKSGNSFTTRRMWRVDTTGAGTAFLDGLTLILPSFAVSASNTDAPALQLVRPWVPGGSGIPTSQTFPVPAGAGAVVDVVAGPNGYEHYYITDRATLTARVWRLDATTGVSSLVAVEQGTGAAGSVLRRLAVGRLGDLYTVEGTAVRRYDIRNGAETLLDTYVATGPIAAITYDDDNDRVVLLTEVRTGPRTIVTLTRGLDSPVVGGLPLTINADAWIADDQELPNTYWIAGRDVGVVRRVQRNALSGDYATIDSIGPFFGAPLTLQNLSMLDGNRVLFELNGDLREYEEDASGNWVLRAGSRWAGQSLGSSFAVSRSRSDFNAANEDGPEFRNVEFPLVLPALGGPENAEGCYANCDGSTISPVLNAIDFSCFLNRYRQDQAGALLGQLSSYANCDASTTVPVLNALDFGCFLQRYRAGCP